MKETKLQRSGAWNPFFINGLEITGFVFFKNNEKIGEVFSGWFGYSNNYYKEITLPFEVKNKRVEDLKKKQSYILTRNVEGIRERILYIHCDLLDGFKIDKKIIGNTTKEKIYYYDKISFNVSGVLYKPVVINKEKKNVTWEYVPGIYQIKQDVNCNIVKTEYGLELEKISQLAAKKNVKLSTYDIDALKDVLNISIK